LHQCDILTGIMSHPGGRPSKYDPSFIQVAQTYIDSCGREATELPTIEGLALTIGVDDTTLLKWGDEHEEFLATLKELKEKQKAQLVNDGMYGGKEVNSTMAIFLLKCNHGMIETERKLLGNLDGTNLKGLIEVTYEKENKAE
jgi:hypothetical protein